MPLSQPLVRPMIRMSLPYVWSIAEDVDPLGKLDTESAADSLDVMLATFEPLQALQQVLDNSVFSGSLRSSRPQAKALIGLLLEQQNRENYDAKVSAHEIWAIKSAYERFKIAFLSELSALPAYFVDQKGSHDTLTLLDAPLRLFPPDLIAKVPDAKFDVSEAGKSLAYNMPTACGFHLFRATESVLRRYYDHVTGGAAAPKVRNIMVYVNAMRMANCGDERILSVIEQMSKLHRNPLIHPEVALTIDEAISVLGIAHSAVTAMLATLPVVPATTSTSAP